MIHWSWLILTAVICFYGGMAIMAWLVATGRVVPKYLEREGTEDDREERG